MKSYRKWVVWGIWMLACAGGIWLVGKLTAVYPAPGEPVSYAVNQADGVSLAIEKPTWSPFRGYTIRWEVTADSEEVYMFEEDGSHGFVQLERCVDGRWYRLEPLQPGENFPFPPVECSVGGNCTGLMGSVVQKYDNYGTRLEKGTYRLVLKMHAADGTPHYLAAEFAVA